GGSSMMQRLRVVRPAFAALLCLGSCLVGARQARAGSGGPDGAGYTWYDINSGCPVVPDTFNSPTTQTFTVPNNNFIGPIPLGFNFPYYDRICTQIWLDQS